MENCSVEMTEHPYFSSKENLELNLKSEEDENKENDSSQGKFKNCETVNYIVTNSIKKTPLWERFNVLCKNLKEITLMLILCLSTITNFCLLNTPYLICGILFAILFFNSNKFSIISKNILVKAITFYNFISIFLKIIMMIIYSFSKETLSNNINLKTFFIDLGLKFLIENTTTNFINTIICDLIVGLGLFILGMYTYDSKNYLSSKLFFLKNYKRNYSICVGLSIILMTILSSINLNIITLIYTGNFSLKKSL